MVEVTPQAQFIIGIITIVVFTILIIKTIKNISSTNNDGDTIINLDKVSERKRKIKWLFLQFLIVWFSPKLPKNHKTHWQRTGHFLFNKLWLD